MQDLLVKVKRVRLHRIPQSAGPRAILEPVLAGRHTDLLSLEGGLVRL
jgi:hypothetical protein